MQANYDLLVAHDGGELLELPIEPSSMNGIQRKAKLEEMRLGDRASSQRWVLRNVTNDADRIKPIEIWAASLFVAEDWASLSRGGRHGSAELNEARIHGV